jgi:hypothetical protein
MAFLVGQDYRLTASGFSRKSNLKNANGCFYPTLPDLCADGNVRLRCLPVFVTAQERRACMLWCCATQAERPLVVQHH